MERFRVFIVAFLAAGACTERPEAVSGDAFPSREGEPHVRTASPCATERAGAPCPDAIRILDGRLHGLRLEMKQGRTVLVPPGEGLPLFDAAGAVAPAIDRYLALVIASGAGPAPEPLAEIALESAPDVPAGAAEALRAHLRRAGLLRVERVPEAREVEEEP